MSLVRKFEFVDNFSQFMHCEYWLILPAFADFLEEELQFLVWDYE
jgi:hypothetical protein